MEGVGVIRERESGEIKNYMTLHLLVEEAVHVLRNDQLS